MTNPVSLLVQALSKQDPLRLPVTDVCDDEESATTIADAPAVQPKDESTDDDEELSPTERKIREFFQRTDGDALEMVEVPEPMFELVDDTPKVKNVLGNIFTLVYDSIELEVDFDATWENGTGYLDGVVYTDELELSVGQRAKCVDDYDRRVILINTVFGNVAFFERYTPTSSDQPFVIVGHVPDELKYFTNLVGAVSEEDFVHYVGQYGPNIGEASAKLCKAVLEKQACKVEV